MSTLPARSALPDLSRIPYQAPNSIATRNLNRRPWQGALHILQFNWSTYLAAAAAIGATLYCAAYLPLAARAVVLACAAIALGWMASSLLVSHYVYDLSPLYDFSWLARALAHAPRRWINVHSGWDETSGRLTSIFPGAVGEAVDLFDPAIMTEPSIRRARRMSPRQVNRKIPATPARYDNLPFEDASVDTAFAIFAAHELRLHSQRVGLFKEIERVLTKGGEFVLVEHARATSSFLAFGPGFLHFFSRREWRSTAADARLEVRSEFAITPFVHVAIMRRKP